MIDVSAGDKIPRKAGWHHLQRPAGDQQIDLAPLVVPALEVMDRDAQMTWEIAPSCSPRTRKTGTGPARSSTYRAPGTLAAA